MQAKICGLTTAEHVQTCLNYGASFCGFILNYKKSHRFIDYKTAEILTNIPKQNTSYVGVFVDPTEEELEQYSKLKLDYFQIYGNFNSDDISKIKDKYKKKIIVALQIKEKKDILNYKTFEQVADIILFDSSGLHQSLSWNFNWVKDVPQSITKMLAGNINMDTLENLKKITDIVDVSGALETDKVKDVKKIKEFLNKIKKIND
jgi:phosphoribosylanthranilate isomerase